MISQNMARTATTPALTVKASVDTTTPNVPAPPPSPPSSDDDVNANEWMDELPPPPIVERRTGRGWWIAAALLMLLVGVPSVGIAYMALDTVPYYAMLPGDATPTEPLISAPGTKLYTTTDGEVLYTTVITRHMSRLDKFRYDRGWWDENVDVLTERQLFGDRSPGDSREENLKVMGYSKDTATYLALRRLGYQVKIRNGGVIVVDVLADVPSFKVLHKGDVIRALNGTPTPIDVELRPLISKFKPGDTITLTVSDRDGGNRRDLTTTLAARPDGTAYIGISTGVPDDIAFDFPVKLDIDSGAVGGPSAGLAFTLGALDVLTEGDLTGGRDGNGRLRRHGRPDRRHSSKDHRRRTLGSRRVPRAQERSGRCDRRGQGF
jgi:PDZ domain-containing protein